MVLGILYNYKILFEIREHLYNNFIALGFSFCQQKNCSNDMTDTHYSGFMIFSYPNSTDINLDLENYLFEKNIDIDDFEINLTENIKIENNIFGYIFSGIKISEKNNCSNINLCSSNDENKEIEINTLLKENEKIKLLFINNEYYYSIDCTLIYTYIISEPNYEDYNKYISYKDESFGEDSED